jgi:hypothetical protein
MFRVSAMFIFRPFPDLLGPWRSMLCSWQDGMFRRTSQTLGVPHLCDCIRPSRYVASITKSCWYIFHFGGDTFVCGTGLIPSPWDFCGCVNSLFPSPIPSLNCPGRPNIAAGHCHRNLNRTCTSRDQQGIVCYEASSVVSFEVSSLVFVPLHIVIVTVLVTIYSAFGALAIPML